MSPWSSGVSFPASRLFSSFPRWLLFQISDCTSSSTVYRVSCSRCPIHHVQSPWLPSVGVSCLQSSYELCPVIWSSWYSHVLLWECGTVWVCNYSAIILCHWVTVSPFDYVILCHCMISSQCRFRPPMYFLPPVWLVSNPPLLCIGMSLVSSSLSGSDTSQLFSVWVSCPARFLGGFIEGFLLGPDFTGLVQRRFFVWDALYGVAATESLFLPPAGSLYSCRVPLLLTLTVVFHY